MYKVKVHNIISYKIVNNSYVCGYTVTSNSLSLICFCREYTCIYKKYLMF